MLDKSSLQSLSHDELDVVRRFFYLVVPPVLLLEILADLKKAPVGDRNPSVQGLARRIVPSASSPVLPSFKELIEAEFAGAELKMDHRPVVLDGRWIRSGSGERGAEVPVQAEATALMRWQQGAFRAGEEALVERYRDAIQGIETEALQCTLHTEYSPRLKLKSLEHTAEFVSDLMAGAEPRRLLKWFFTAVIPDERLLSIATTKCGNARIEKRFPFFGHCMRVSLIFHFALAFRLVSARPTNRIDIEYLFYLPFTLGFSSGDKLHRQLFEFVRLGKNDFVHRDALKADLGRIKDHLRDNPEDGKLVRPPDLAAGSFTTMMWTKHMKPTSRRRDELMDKLSPEAEKRLVEHCERLRSGQSDESTEDLEEPEFLFRQIEVQPDGPCFCGSGKAFRECHGKNL